jgi:hypothetical protein
VKDVGKDEFGYVPHMQLQTDPSLNICLESECGANLWPLYFNLSNIANSCSDTVPRAVATVTSTIVLAPQAALGTLVTPI